MTLSYEFSQSDYDDDTVASNQIYKMVLGYQLISLPMFEVSLGAGPTYTKLSDSDDSWDANGNLNILYNIGHGSLRLTSDLGTRFDNFSGTDERSLTDYWLSRAEFTYPLYRSMQTSLYCVYSDETRDELDSGSEIDVEGLSVGGILKYPINDSYDVGLGYGYTVQDSECCGDSYDEHRVNLMMSYKTDLFTW